MGNFTPIREIGEREQQIFRLLVEQYIQDGAPVGSRTLSKMPGVNVSAASVRNVMGDLEELGLLESPHTSAGRVPTCDGFRLFVDTMLEVQPIVENELDPLKVALTPDQDEKSLIQHTSKYLSHFTNMAGVVTLPKRGETIFRQIEFLPLSEQRVLVILVVNEKNVQNRILTLDRDYEASELQEISNYLNQTYSGKNLESVKDLIRSELENTRESMNDQMQHMINLAGSVFENQESGYGVLDNCSLVTSSYKVDGEVVGILGVVGPTRMAYDRVVPVVDVTSRLLSAALNSSS